MRIYFDDNDLINQLLIITNNQRKSQNIAIWNVVLVNLLSFGHISMKHMPGHAPTCFWRMLLTALWLLCMSHQVNYLNKICLASQFVTTTFLFKSRLCLINTQLKFSLSTKSLSTKYGSSFVSSESPISLELYLIWC